MTNTHTIKNVAAKRLPAATTTIAGIPVPDNLLTQRLCFAKLLQCIQQKENVATILLLGPGCTWLAMQLAQHSSARVTAINLSVAEIKAARETRTVAANLQLSTESIDSKMLHHRLFDMIILCASAGYFFSLPGILKKALSHLSLAGEIHICGSAFGAAKEVSIKNTRPLSVAYFQHTLNDLRGFQYRVLHEPAAFLNWFSLTKNPFHHIVIKNYYL